ncbi:ABC transporter permease [Arcanobacterium ihumii]|uniref:ABC transporter permease n=1 Tax=Arcanobacterium ihumii TaxID=2138162 RepID=UPI00135CE088|nr:FtsX-like permease family protein [Arcanobacterium ihumii]
MDKTVGHVSFAISDPNQTAKDLEAKLKEIPEVESVYFSTDISTLAISGPNAITANVNYAPPLRWSDLDIDSGNLPKDDQHAIISASTAEALNLSIGDSFSLSIEDAQNVALHKLVVSGIYSRSPFSTPSNRFEILVNSIDDVLSTKTRTQHMAENNYLYVIAKPHSSRAALGQKIAEITDGNIQNTDEIRKQVVIDQTHSIEYYQSILSWLLIVPMLLSGFVIAVSTHTLVKNRCRTIAQLRLLGASQFHIFVINAAEILVVAIISTVLGHAIGRAIVQSLVELMKSGYGGAYIPQTFTVTPSDYICAALGSIGIALIASLPSVIAYSFVSETYIYAKPKHQKPKRLTLLAISIVLLVLGTAALFFTIIVPEDFLYIALTGNETQSLRLMAMVGLFLLAAFVSFVVLRFIVSGITRKIRFRKSMTSLRLASTQHYADMASRIGTLMVIGTAACLMGLTTMSSIKTTAYQESGERYVPYDASARILDPSHISSGSVGIDTQSIVGLLDNSNIDRVLPLPTMVANLDYEGAPSLENLYIYSMDTEAAKRYFGSDARFLKKLEPGTIVIPRDLMGSPTSDLPDQVTLTRQIFNGDNLSSTPIGSPVTFKARYAPIPWTIITPSDFSRFASTSQIAEVWIRFSSQGLQHRDLAYQATIDIIKKHSQVPPNLTLATKLPSESDRNTPASILTLGLLTISLILCIIAVCNSLFLSQQARRSEFRTLSGLGISPHLLSTSLVVSAIGRTTLAVIVGALAGVASGIYLAQSYIGAITWNQIFSIPWISIAILVLVSTLLAGTWTRIQTLFPTFSHQSNRQGQ